MTRYRYLSIIKTFLILFLYCSVPTYADIFQRQDANGSKHFSERSHLNSKKLAVRPGYSYDKVSKIYDGDSIMLEDGRKIRLLGINTPEVKHRNQINEAGGEAAKNWLSNKLINHKVRLEADIEQTDKYKRTLAHLFTENKEHINLTLVEMGLVAVNIYPRIYYMPMS